MSGVEELREAARLMRECAEECGSFRGPWRFEAAEGDWPTVGRLSTADDDPHGLIASLWPSAGCGQHIASWHPGVALAVADLLDSLADFYVAHDMEPTPMPLAVARAYLAGVAA